jgi:hypothetical protein
MSLNRSGFSRSERRTKLPHIGGRGLARFACIAPRHTKKETAILIPRGARNILSAAVGVTARCKDAVCRNMHFADKMLHDGSFTCFAVFVAGGHM